MDRFLGKPGITIACGVLVAAVLALAACGGDDDDGGDAGGDTSVAATLGGDAGEFVISLDPTSAAAGAVLFEVTNSGETEHEFEVFKTDAAPEDIPIVEGKADMEAVEAEEIEELEDVEPGATVELETDLEAGTYLIICNIPSHFEQGMHTGFTVE